MDVLYAICTAQANASALCVEQSLCTSLGYEERLEFVRCWARQHTHTQSSPEKLPKFRSPTLTTPDELTKWLGWALHSEHWARAAVHAKGALIVSEEYTIQRAPPYPHRLALSQFLSAYSKNATLARSGQSYLNGVVRLACPGYSTSISSTSAFLHASDIISDDINSIMSPCVHRTVARQYEDVKWSSATPSQFMLAAAILADATGSAPVYLNTDVLRRPNPDKPSMFVSHDFDISCGNTVAVVVGRQLYIAHHSYLDVIGEFIRIQTDNGIHAALAGTAPPPPRLAAYLKR